MFIAGVLFNDVRSGRSEMFIAALVLRSYGARCLLKIAKAINMLLLRSKSRCVKYVDAQISEEPKRLGRIPCGKPPAFR
jgi:hypothetical protein